MGDPSHQLITSDQVRDGLKLTPWNTFYQASWYVYGAFMTKNSLDDDKSINAEGLRIFLTVWLFFGFIITCIYSGNLTAFLTQPGYTAPIDNLGDVLKSSLPWGMVGISSTVEREHRKISSVSLRLF
jgi:hypothetical protein